jgi:adenine-specific DNA-methyltransferase
VGVRLEWEGKPTRVERLSLPFQTVETINESRATRERDRGSLLAGTRDPPPDRNRLIWGDNKLVMGSLLRDYAGQIKVIYLDPPFDTGDDFTYQIPIGDGSIEKAPSILEEHAYRDTWGAGHESYLSIMFARLVLMHDLLSETGTIYLRCDWRVNALLRLVLDEIFGADAFVNEIVWHYFGFKRKTARNFPRKHDTILVYAKGGHPDRTWNVQYKPHRPEYVARFKKDSEGRLYRDDVNPTGGGRRVIYLDEVPGDIVDSVWDDIPPVNPAGAERWGYATQKPEALLARIIEASTDDGDLVADFFVGSGTTAAVAEKLGRRWIACDLGRFAIHTTRKRLLNIPDCRPFEIQNLGAYERQRWQQESGNGAVRAYIDTILAFYRAEPVEGFVHLHGRKAGRMVHVGATDAPVTIDECEEVMDEMADNAVEACDLLGWEWEMGLHDTIGELARRRGLDLRPRQIPREVMEREVAEADAVRFFELAYVDLDVRRQGREACVVLKDFVIPSEELIPPQVRERVSGWSDLVDYWSVDFDYRDETFHNEWQAYRTREEPALATQSDWHEYPEPGRYAIVVKIIDIFGNDTTKLAEVRIK